MKTTHLTALAALIASLSACTSTAGPFVTNVSSAGPGRLRVEKCEVEFSPYGYAHVQTGECTTETVSTGQ